MEILLKENFFKTSLEKYKLNVFEKIEIISLISFEIYDIEKCNIFESLNISQNQGKVLFQVKYFYIILILI